jgi:putative membrane protein
MKKLLTAASIAALTLGLAACGSHNDSAQNGSADTMAADNMAGNDMAMNDMNAMAGDNMAMAGNTMAPIMGADFANAAAASDMYEVESSKLAQDKSANADLKSFAKMLVTDHTRSTADLKAAGAKANPPITPKPEMTAEQQSNLDALKSASAADFDQLYIGQQIPAHEKALAMLQSYASGGDVPELKAFASKTAPVVQTHLDKARAMKK